MDIVFTEGRGVRHVVANNPVRFFFLWGLIFGVIFTPLAASAYWKEPSDVVEGTAYNLKSGEFSIGVFAPLQYAITDEFTISLHPILELLLTPNLGFRAEVYEGPVVVNVTGSYLQTFLGVDELGGYQGRGEGGAIVSVPVSSRLILSLFGGLSQRFTTLTEKDETFLVKRENGSVDFGTNKTVREIYSEELDTDLLATVGLNWVITQRHLLIGQVRLRDRISPEPKLIPEGTIQWAIAWERMRFSLGMQFGEQPFRDWAGDQVSLPVYPLMDLWIRLYLQCTLQLFLRLVSAKIFFDQKKKGNGS